MKGRLFEPAISAFLLFTCSTISLSAECELVCHEISLDGSLRAGEQFSREIGTHCGNLRLDFRKPFLTPRGHDNGGSRLSQAQHDRLADATTAACDNSTPSFERQQPVEGNRGRGW